MTGAERLYNTAAVFRQGSVVGLYRKLYPAMNRSVYDAGGQMPVFQIDGLTFGIVICNDSNYPEPARVITSKGATALFVPTNNGLPPEKADVAAHARSVDIALAIENNVCVVRADVAGRNSGMVSYGSSGIVDPHGNVLQSARQLTEELIVADLDVSRTA
jgi:predicted amidohydrolase